MVNFISFCVTLLFSSLFSYSSLHYFLSSHFTSLLSSIIFSSLCSSFILLSSLLHYFSSFSSPSMPSSRSLLHVLMDCTVLHRTLPYYTVRRFILLYNLMYHSHQFRLPILRRTYNIACSTYNAPSHLFNSTLLLLLQSALPYSLSLYTTLLYPVPLYFSVHYSTQLSSTLLYFSVPYCTVP